MPKRSSSRYEAGAHSQPQDRHWLRWSNPDWLRKRLDQGGQHGNGPIRHREAVSKSPLILRLVPFILWAAAAWIVAATASYMVPPVSFKEISIEQLPDDPTKPDHLLLRLNKAVMWHRWCHGTSSQKFTPVVEPGSKESAMPIPLSDNIIKVPSELGLYTGSRDIYVPKSVMPPGTYRYKICSDMACWPWEDLWPIRADCMQSMPFTVTK